MKKIWLWFVLAMCACAWWVAPSSSGQAPAERELIFAPLKIDGPVHDPARHTYWFGPFAECSSVLDIDGDGKLDIAAGRNYYIAPKWTKYPDYREGAETNGPDVDDNYEGTMDVNNDGRPDVLSSGWMRRQGIWWYENPGKLGVKWTSHALHPADGLEGMVIGNLAGHDGKDVLVNYFAKKPGRGLVWFEHINQPPWFKEHVLGPENVGVSHGSGIGDINGDGRNDVVTTSGWFESPPRPTEDKWIWHPDWEFSAFGADGRPGGAGLPILVTDVNGDGLNDVIIGSDHGYGLAWYEQRMEGGKRSFVKHWIETEYPTFHTMLLADLDGDGKPELVTGKQLFAHNGADVGGFEPVFLFYYKFDKGRFQRHIISYSHLTPYFGPGSENTPPPDNIVGTGMRLNAADMDGDGKLDIVVACKTGLYIFFNKGYSPRTRGTNWLPDRATYPSHKAWETKRPPAAQSPRAEIDNGQIQAKIYLPDAKSGYYRGTRFDWSGVLSSLQYKGHDYYGPWFQKTDPKVRDFTYEGSDIVAGPCSAITGPVDEFGPLGWDEAKPGGAFVKIGVGALRKPEEGKYDHFRLYEIVDTGQWTVKKNRDAVEFTQKLDASSSGYGYSYQKTVKLTKGKPEMVLEHSLKNTGTRAIETDVYNHNFLVLDRHPTGPDFVITVPFQIQTPRPPAKELAEIRGNRIVYLKVLKDRDVVTIPVQGFTGSPKDHEIRIENRKLGVGLKISGDRPLASESLWSIRTVMAMEPFVSIRVEPGQEFSWKSTYSFYTLPVGTSGF